MAEQTRSDDDESKLKSSLRKLKERFLPGLQYTLIIAAIFNFSMLVVGCLNIHNCPINKKIPLFLIVLGAIGLLSKFVSYFRERISQWIKVKYIETVLYSVETIFFLLGTYWVYSEFKPSFEPQQTAKYCDKTTYLFAFIYLTVYYTILLAVILGFCCFVGCALCLGRAESRGYDVEAQQPASAEAKETLTGKNESVAKAE